ncbi:MAG: DUF3078 domain-containing protein [Hyphomicrobiales bacterium]
MCRPLLLCLTAASLLAASAARAADPKPVEPGPWKFGTLLGVNLTQSAFSDNWKGGDRGSVVWVANGDLTLERQFTTKFHLSNHLQAAYGQTAQQVVDPANPRQRAWDSPEKSTDLLALESVGRFSLGGYVDPFVSFRGETQFADQSSPIGTIRFNPVTLKETAGIARVFEKTDSTQAISRIGFAFRETIAKSFVDAVTKEKQSFTATDGGIDWQTEVTQPILGGRVLYKGALGVYKALFYSKSDQLKAFDVRADSAAAANGTTHAAVADYWKAVDVSFQNTFTAQITKILSVNLFAQWAYDKFDAAANLDPTQTFQSIQAEVQRNTRRAGQFKETLALGLTYRLF